MFELRFQILIVSSEEQVTKDPEGSTGLDPEGSPSPPG